MASSLENSAWLQWMSNLLEEGSRQTYTVTLPPDRFYCLLDELPVHLIPQRVFKSLQLQECGGQELYLNPDCIVCSDGRLPEELEFRRELVSGFALQGTIAWVRSPSIANLLPFWLGPQTESAIRDLRPGEQVPSWVPDDTRRLLMAAGILVFKDQANRRRRERAEVLRTASTLPG